MPRTLIHLILITALTTLCACERPSAPEPPNHPPERIISMAPNITETIYALGLQTKLVGATTHCLYPPAATNIPRVGGFGQFNYEAIVTLSPDLIILHQEYDAEKTRLEGLAIPYLETGSYFIHDILSTIKTIGSACGAETAASNLTQQLNNRIVTLTAKQPNPPRVLITFGGSADDEIGQTHAFGTECIHNELLELAGGKNVIESKQPYSILSKEALLRLNPEIIIELAPGMSNEPHPHTKWNSLPSISAVQHNRIHRLTGNYTCIPGPRFIQILEDFSHIIGGE